MKEDLKEKIYLSIRIILVIVICFIIYGLKTNKIQDAYQKNFYPKQYRAKRVNQLETESKYFKSQLAICAIGIQKKTQMVNELKFTIRDKQELVKIAIQGIVNEIESDKEMIKYIKEIIHVGEEELNRITTEDSQVKRVIDGDTLELINGERVCLIGIDAPESKPNDKAKKDSERTGKDLETITKMGQEATEFVKGLVEGKEVRLEFDVQQRDKYGRLLAYVYIPVQSSYLARDKDGSLPDFSTRDVADSFSDKRNGFGVVPGFLNAHIVRNGYASPMTISPNIKYAVLFKELYQEAKWNKRGLWKDE